MNDKQRRIFERSERVDAFMDLNAADFPVGGRGKELAARLKGELAKLSTLDVAKASVYSTQQQASAGRRDLRESLRARVASICNTAEIIGLDRTDVRGLFPRIRIDNSDRTLLAVARAFIEAATPFKALFIEYEMEPDFIDGLRADTEAFEAQMTRQTEGTGSRVSTNAAIGETLARMDEIVERLDVVVHNKYRADPAQLAAWESAHHLERAPHSRSGNDPAQTPPASA